MLIVPTSVVIASIIWFCKVMLIGANQVSLAERYRNPALLRISADLSISIHTNKIAEFHDDVFTASGNFEEVFLRWDKKSSFTTGFFLGGTLLMLSIFFDRKDFERITIYFSFLKGC